MILFLFAMGLWAQEVVIQGEQTSNINYQKHLMENPQRQSFIQHQILRKPALTYELLSKLKSAQFEFLNGDLKKAREHFQKIASLQHLANWGSRERESIHYSLMRLAQLQRGETQRQAWLRQAVALDYYRKPNPKLFPPPLINDYQKLRRKMVQNIWQLPRRAELFDTVLINGKKQKGYSGFIKTVDAVQRIQLLSNRYLPVHYVARPLQLKNLTIKLVPLAYGSCDRPIFNADVNPKENWIYMTDNCTSNNKLPLMARKSNPIQNSTMILDSMKKKKRSSQFYESKWFWIGLSSLVAGFAIYDGQNRQSRSNNPSPKVQSFSNQ